MHRSPIKRQMKRTILLVLMEIIIFGKMTSCAVFRNGAPLLEDVEPEKAPSQEIYDDESFIVKTLSCVIPSFNSQDKPIDELFEIKDQIKVCKHYNKRLLESNRTHIWVVKNNFKHYKIYNESNFVCCYRSFHRPRSSENLPSNLIDSRIDYLDCINFDNFIEANNEYVKVTCFYEDIDQPVYEQYFIFTPKKPFTKFRDEPFITAGNQSMYNVIIMGISSMSRQNFHRTMTETVELLISNNAIELKGYSSLAPDTFQNMMPLLVGMNSSELESSCLTDREPTLDSCPFIWERFKDMGYYTALMEDTSRRSMFKDNSMGFRGSPTDYYTHPFIHESEIIHVLNRRQNEKPVLSCIGDKYYFQVMVKYIQDITTTLKDFKLFGVFWESSMTESSINAPEKMDYEYYKLLTNMDLGGYLKDTIIIFMSDHGLDVGDIRITKQGRMEQRLPLFIMLLPPSFRQQYSLAYDNIKKNEGRLTTPFDVHKTLLDLIDMNELTDERILKRGTEFYSRNRGISLFLEIPRNRTCRTASIDKSWCACIDEVPLVSSNPLLAKAIQFITNAVNEMLEPYPQCLKLIVEEIVIAKELVPVYETTTDWRDIKLVIGMEPGGGIFETVLRYHRGEWTFIDSIRRLNCLGFQSLCVDDPVVKMLCSCKRHK